MIGALKSGRGNRKHSDNCVGCGVPLLTRKRFARPPEGYEWHQGHGKCGRCYSQSRPRTLSAPNCTDCGRPFRLQHESIEDRPGTMIHAGRGLCKTDYEIRRKSGSLPQRADEGYASPSAPAVDPEAVARKTEHDRRELVAYIRARRARGWPADGTMPVIEGL
jgi:hypothetical protein